LVDADGSAELVEALPLGGEPLLEVVDGGVQVAAARGLGGGVLFPGAVLRGELSGQRRVLLEGHCHRSPSGSCPSPTNGTISRVRWSCRSISSARSGRGV
jgi:hypothetical protein